MGEYESRGPTHAGPTSASSGYSAPAREVTPAERARDAVSLATRQVTTVRTTLAELQAAHDANDLTRWKQARRALATAIAPAERRFDQTRGQLRDAAPETTERFETTTRELAADIERARAVAAPPGYVLVARETQLVAALRAPSIAGFSERRDAVDAELEELSIADLRVLRARIASPQPQDELAGEIWKLGPKLRNEVASFIENVDRRKARARAAAARSPAPVVAPAPETLDVKLRRAFEGSNIEVDLMDVIASLDALARRELRARLMAYRQGSGDEIGARFQRLERELQTRALDELARETPRPVAVGSAPTSPDDTSKAAIRDRYADDLSSCERDAAKHTRPSSPKLTRGEVRVVLLGHVVPLIARISDRIIALGVPEPHPRLQWTAIGARFVAKRIRADLERSPGDLVERLEQLAPELDVLALATQLLGPDRDIEIVARELAIAFDRPIAESVIRVGARVRAAMDINHGAADVAHAVVSSHLDRLISDAMQGHVHGDALARAQRPELEGKSLAAGPRHVEFEWLGKTRGEDLWNWILVKTPHDATREDVASTPLAGGKALGLEEAYRIAASPPYFGLPPELARLAPEALAHAPAAIKSHRDSPAHDADPSALAHSTASDGAALAQAPKSTRADLSADHALARLDLELRTIQYTVTPWHADPPIGAALAFVARREAELARDPKRGPQWSATLSAQERTVHDVAEELGKLVAGQKPGSSKLHDEAVAAYVHVVEVSHLAVQAVPALARARELVAMMPLTALEQQLVGQATGDGDRDGALRIAERAATIRAAIERGGGSPDAMAEVLVDGDEHALRGQLDRLGHQLDDIDRGAAETGIPDSDYANGLPTLHAMSSQLRHKIANWRDDLDKSSHLTGTKPDVVKQRRNTLTQIGTELEAARDKLEVDKYLAWAECTIGDRRRVIAIAKLVARMAAEIAIMIASMQLATAAITAVRGVMLGVELANDVREVSLVVRLATAVVGSGISTTVNGALGGDVSASAYIENAVALATMTAFMAPFEGMLARSAEIEAEVRTFSQKIIRSGASLALEMVSGYVGSVAGQAAVHGFAIASPTSGDALEQLFPILVGKFIHQRMSSTKVRLETAERELGRDAVSALRKRVENLELESGKNKRTTPADALAMLAERNALLIAERALYKGNQALAADMKGEPTLGEQFADVPLVLSHLEPVIQGHSYLGTREHIDAGIKALGDAGMQPHELPAEIAGTRRVKVGERVIELREMAGAVTAAPKVATTEVRAALEFTSQDRKHISELDRVSRELAAAHAEASAAKGRVAELEHRVAELERALRIDQAGGAAAERRRHAVDVQREVLADAPRRAAVRKELDGDRGHPGVELHSHFMGIVEPEVYRQRAATAGGAKDTGSWQPLLEKIESLPALEAAHHEAQGKTNEPSAFRHKVVDGKIEHRAKAGDASRIAREAWAQVGRLDTRAENAKNEGDRASFQRAAEVVAEEASRTALTSTPETPFDGSYEIIDALIKTTFGGSAHAGESAKAAEQRAFDDYIEQAILRLAETGTDYSEQSTGVKKLAEKVHPDRILAIRDRLIADGRLRPGQVEITMLGMVSTRHYGERPADLSPAASSSRKSREKADADNAAVRHQTAHPRIVGRDIGAPEAYAFDQEGIAQYKRDYVGMRERAAVTGSAQVDRPHVGEGSMDTEPGKPFHTDKDRVLHGDKPAHYDRARNNLEMLLTAADQLRTEGLWDPTKVITRYGHATHATPQQAAHMRALGIVAEVNLGSNVATGSLSQTEGSHGGRSKEPRYQDHSLPSLVYYDTAVVLSTDGSGVMSTTLAKEYARANQIIEAVLAGEQPVRVSISDATVAGRVRGTEVADAMVRELYIDELTQAERDRFLHAYEKLYADVDQYVMRRPKPAGERHHHTTTARDAGLVSKLGEATYEGTTAQVLAAARSYRAKGYTVLGDSVEKGETLEVVVSIPRVFTTTLIGNDTTRH